MIGYLDTSALVKLIVTEQGSEAVVEAWAALDPMASIVGYAELRATVAAVARHGRLSNAAIESLRAQADLLWARVVPVNITPSVVRLAGALAESHALRALDAIHLASACVLRDRAGNGPVVVTFDRQLAAAATTEGLRVIPTPA